MIILQIIAFLLLLLLAFVVLAAMVLYRVYRRSGLGKVFDLLRGRGGARQHAGQASQGHEARPGQQTTTAHGDVIIDRRSSKQASQKIFAQDEGEYVDYKEE